MVPVFCPGPRPGQGPRKRDLSPGWPLRDTFSVLAAVSELDHSTQRRALLALAKLEGNPRPDGVEKFRGATDRRRIRAGDWRIVYRIEDGRLTILVVAIGHRGKVYRDE
ncbi:type II toxin-antitoxin system RelE family toxin [Glycomyces harbinensis]|uniref:type II toxin-antitoxin system RelE family toxin n=1 Tax=Glycomyces harbinensis TaxID=58114 RepID=UPI001C40B3EF